MTQSICTFTFTIVFILCVPPHVVAESVGGTVHGEGIPLKSGAIPYIKKARLGEPSTFYNELDGSTTCYPLFVEGQHVDWIYRVLRTKILFLLYKCETYQSDIETVPDAPKDAIHGWIAPESYTLEYSGNKWILRELDIPNYGGLANDTYCETLIAYWVFVDDVLQAYVYDLQSKRLVFKREVVGSKGKHFGTDDPGALGEPKWNRSCTAVQFPTNYFVEIPITAEITN